MSATAEVKHGDERNRHQLVDVEWKEDVVDGAAVVVSGSSWTRDVYEKWCAHCKLWIRCDGIMGALGFWLIHESKETHK